MDMWADNAWWVLITNEWPDEAAICDSIDPNSMDVESPHEPWWPAFDTSTSGAA